MTEEKETHESSDMADWLQARPAQVARNFFAEQLKLAENRLDAACRDSSDPKVKAAYETRIYARAVVNYLKTGKP